MRIMGCIKTYSMGIALGTALSSCAQDISLQLKDAPVTRFLDQLQKQSGYVVILIQPVFRDHPRVTLSADHQPLEKLLRQVLTPLDAEYALIDKNIVIRETAQRITAIPNNTTAITGRILDTLGNSIPNATLRISSDDLAGTISDKEGRFQIRIDENKEQELVISSVGYQTVERTLHRADSFLLIRLREDFGSFDAAQVTAYGETTQRLTTAGSQTISSTIIAQYPVDNAMDVIQDLTTGVFVQRQSGASGSAYSTHVRGINSLTGTVNTQSQPLIVVDGVAYPGSTLPFQAGRNPAIQQGGNGLNYLLPEMIETITVLKDADALSVYGSRGAYGVILIKTKSGRSHSSGIAFSESAGVATPGIVPHLMNTDQYLTIRREALANDGTTPGPFDSDLNGTWSQQSDINWPKYFYKKRSGLSDAYLTWHDGNDGLSWSVGGGFRYDGGLLVNGGGNKTGGLHYNINAFQNARVSLTVIGIYTHTYDDNTPFDPLGVSSPDRLIYTAPNAPPMLNPDGSLNWKDYPGNNPGMNIRRVYWNSTNNSVTGATIAYKPTSQFTVKLGFGYNTLTGGELLGVPSTSLPPGTPVDIPGSPINISSAIDHYQVDTWTLEPNANFSTRLFNKSTLSLTLGGTAQDQKNYMHALIGSHLSGDNVLDNPGSAPPGDRSYSFNGYDERYLGFFGLLNYNWQETYILNLGLRRDGSSVFGASEQFGNFYSVGAAWLLSKERWFNKLLPSASFAKLRGSYGTVGGDNIVSGQDAATFTPYGSYQGNTALLATQPANPYLHWEFDKKWNAALDLNFFNDRIAVEVEYYHTHVSDQLEGMILSYVTGFNYITSNDNALLTSYGIEYSLRTWNVRRERCKWTTEINFTLPRNVLTAFPLATAQVLNDPQFGQSYQYVLPAQLTGNLGIGRSVQGVLALDYRGVNPQDGNLLFRNAAGETGEFLGLGQMLGTQDKTKFINLAPNYFGSVINTLILGRWELNVVIGFTDRMGINYPGSQNGQPGYFNINFPKEVLTHWEKPGDKTAFPRPTNDVFGYLSWQYFTESTGAYSHAGYCRLDNLSLTYKLTAGLVKRWYSGELNLFLQGQNLVTVTKYHDYDPANLGVGMPLEKRIVGGIKMML
jgi:TonB-linked SusC/RagA family outer membrane protein